MTVFTLLAAIGSGVEVHWMDSRLVAEAIDWLRQLDRDRACG